MTAIAVTLTLACPAATAEGSTLRAAVTAPSAKAGQTARPAARKCSAHRAVRFYAARAAYWLDKLGAAPHKRPSTGPGCPRYLAHLLQRKAAALRERWEFLFDYRAWMPAFWRAIAVCESGSNPPNWRHDSGPYVSAFGITVAEYDRDAAVFGAPPWHVRHTPRDQYRAARGHQERFGLTGWGCYTHGGYLVHLGHV